MSMMMTIDGLMQCVSISSGPIYPFSPPEKKIELTFILCGLISVPVFLISLSRSLQMLRFFVTQIYQKIRTFTHKHEIHQHIICPPLKKKTKKRCWLIFRKKSTVKQNTLKKTTKFGRAEREAKFCLFFPTFFLLPIVFSLLFSLFLDVAFFFI